MSNKLELAGKKFGRLTVVEEAGRANKFVLWRCRCDCGNEVIVRSSALNRGVIQSCGCKSRDTLKKILTTHGESKTRLYHIWGGMISRCRNDSFKYYKGKGIKVCEEWLDFHAFKEWAFNNGYNDTLTIERIDNSKNYSPENCRWATRKEQSRNTERNVFFGGKCLAEICEELGLNYARVYSRLKKGWSLEDAIRVSRFGKKNGFTIPELCKGRGINPSTVYSRLKRGFTLEKALQIGDRRKKNGIT